MKRMKKWLLPVLTGLIVVGAAALPAQISRARDARQFGQVHREELAVNALPDQDAPTLTDRLTLFVSQYYPEHPVLSYMAAVESEESYRTVTQRGMELLTESGIFPSSFSQDFEKKAVQPVNVNQLLLWDPAKEWEPALFWQISWDCSDTWHIKHLNLMIDGETGAPVRIDIRDTNLAQWLPYKTAALQDVADRYFDVMGWAQGVDVAPMDGPADQHELAYSVTGAEFWYVLSQGPTSLTIHPELSGAGAYPNDTAASTVE